MAILASEYTHFPCSCIWPDIRADWQGAQLVPGHDWVPAEAEGLSVTHIEMLSGVLRLPVTQRRAAIYLRDPSYLVGFATCNIG